LLFLDVERFLDERFDLERLGLFDFMLLRELFDLLLDRLLDLLLDLCLEFFDFLLELLGVLERRVLRRLERRLADRDRDADLLGPFGVRARRADLFREADLLALLFDDLGVRLRLDDFFRDPERLLLLLLLDDFGLLALREALLESDFLGPLGVRARREDFDRLTLVLLLEAFREVDLLTLRLLALGVLERLAVRRLARAARLPLDLFGPFGVRARREDLLRETLRLELFLCAFGVRDRREDLRLAERDLLRVRERFCFFADFALESERALFLTPISLFLFSNISALY